MKKGQKQLLIQHIIAFVVMSNSGHILIKNSGDIPKRFNVDFGEENPRKPQFTKTMREATDKARKEVDKYLEKTIKDLNKNRHPNIGPVTAGHFLIREVRLNTSMPVKNKTRGEQEMDKMNRDKVAVV